jgi:protein-S-isoprenylcysteine O-methyltransferase Ste14
MSGVGASLSLALRSAFWALLLPGMIAGFIPWRAFGLAEAGLEFSSAADLIGLVLITVGFVLLLICIREFAQRGRGTLAPIDAPRELVVQGLYRYVRNPMYVAVAAILIGELLIIRTVPMLWYVAVWFGAVNLFVIGYEEPTLRRRFGDSYERYAQSVRRWVPRF